MTKLTKTLLLLAAIALGGALTAHAEPSKIIQQQVAVCDPWYPTQCSAPGGSSYTTITTDADTVIKASPGTLAGLIVGTAGTTSTATIYDNTTCTGTVIGTFSTTAQVSLSMEVRAGTGLCVTTAGGSPATITVLWR